ncbi:hypothetical protein EDC01DRAFT_777598 [Geopyxis carbonaria]|nr:hypothetical protein EDC01DRAFT_777598 [Geopyxis carbonaria]
MSSNRIDTSILRLLNRHSVYRNLPSVRTQAALNELLNSRLSNSPQALDFKYYVDVHYYRRIRNEAMTRKRVMDHLSIAMAGVVVVWSGVLSNPLGGVVVAAVGGWVFGKWAGEGSKIGDWFWRGQDILGQMFSI